MKNPKGTYRFIISGGGTGGHIYPAVAIAHELKKRYADAEFLFVGAKDKMEMEKIPAAGFPIEGLPIAGLQRRLTYKNILLPFKLVYSLLQSGRILNRFKPHVAIGTGGYASAPLLRMAARKKIPCLLQEQNSLAGIANRWLSKRAETVCVAYPGMEAYFPKEKIKLTGNPVRQDLLNIESKKEEAQKYFKLNPGKKTVLILGGSLGAKKINELAAGSLEVFEKNGVQLLWQCGALYEESYRHFSGEAVRVFPFLNRMDLAYAAADIIISRSGALSVSELCVVGKPVIFIPSPNVAEDHQTKNARVLASEQAAVLIPETELNRFEKEFENLINSEKARKNLAENIRKFAKPHAAAEIADEIEKLLKKRSN